MIVEKYEWVKKQLTDFPALRDSNERLYYRYLLAMGYDVDTKTAKEFLKDMETRAIPYLDSVSRASRKVQEEHPHLRGELYNKRKVKQEQVKEEIQSI